MNADLQNHATYNGNSHSTPLQDEFKGIIPAIPVPNNSPAVIAGPCSAENREQTLSTARMLADIGVKVFRAGLWKPRTRPGCFEGCGEAGLEWMAEVKEATGMLTATEVACARHAEMALNAGIDILWLGARTTTNPFAVQEIAEALQGTDAAVLVKNPANPDLELWIGALQRIHNAGISRLSAVHRGFSSYGSRFYRNPPQWHIPIELHRRLPDMQLICDPSHIGGRRDLILPLARQAMGMGFSGVIVESHCNPDEALSDAAQQITPAALSNLLPLLAIPSGHGIDNELQTLRQQIDQLDGELLEILCKRMKVATEIGRLKKNNNLPVLQPDRYDALMKSRVEEAEAMGLDRDFISTLLAAIHAESVSRQLRIE